jgi:hypothetical protein
MMKEGLLARTTLASQLTQTQIMKKIVEQLKMIIRIKKIISSAEPTVTSSFNWSFSKKSKPQTSRTPYDAVDSFLPSGEREFPFSFLSNEGSNYTGDITLNLEKQGVFLLQTGTIVRELSIVAAGLPHISQSSNVDVAISNSERTVPIKVSNFEVKRAFRTAASADELALRIPWCKCNKASAFNTLKSFGATLNICR